VNAVNAVILYSKPSIGRPIRVVALLRIPRGCVDWPCLRLEITAFTAYTATSPPAASRRAAASASLSGSSFFA
jgi:hypothetical protein